MDVGNVIGIIVVHIGYATGSISAHTGIQAMVHGY